mmetsp:Transcript_11239/g.33680  ORF Transcript_11239/g.33680 Transcript_11239/m.33680 type:complete len:501 (-) Transcript_11239:30-1532(-)
MAASAAVPPGLEAGPAVEVIAHPSQSPSCRAGSDAVVQTPNGDHDQNDGIHVGADTVLPMHSPRTSGPESPSQRSTHSRVSVLVSERYTQAELLSRNQYAWLKTTHYLKGRVAVRERALDNMRTFCWKVRFVELSLIAVVAWLLLGTLVYYFASGFTLAQSFYFSVQTGFSVGFGATNVTVASADHNELTQWYTIAHVLIGSSVIAMALALWAKALVASAHSRAQEVKDILRDKHLQVDDDFATRRAADEGEGIPMQSITDDKSEEVDDDGIVIVEQCRWTGDYTLALGLIFLIIAGCIFGGLYQKWRFSQSLLFSISAMSTGGLIAPSTSNFAMVFTGMYCMIGIPWYAYALAATATWLQSADRDAAMDTLVQKGFRKLTACLIVDELKRQNKGKSDPRLNWTHFLELYLVKLKLATEEDLRRIRKKYDSMQSRCEDSPDSGLSIFDVNVDLAFHEFARMSVTGRNFLDFDAFVAFCVVVIEDEVRFCRTVATRLQVGL